MSPQPMPSAQTDLANDELAKQLYDILMADIEPDLLLANIPSLDAQYAGETPEEHEARMKRYEAAYAKFDEQFAGFMSDVNAEVRTSKRESLAAKEAAAQHSDRQALSSLESAFS